MHRMQVQFLVRASAGSNQLMVLSHIESLSSPLSKINSHVLSKDKKVLGPGY